MTAFARTQTPHSSHLITWEIRTVNHRHLDLHLRLPEKARSTEQACRDLIQSQLKRGRFDGFLSLEPVENASQTFELNTHLLKQVAALSDQVIHEVPGSTPLNVNQFLHWPGLVTSASTDESDLEEAILAGLKQALTELTGYREREGARLHATLVEKVNQIETLTQDLQQQYPHYETELKVKWQSRVDALLTDELDSTRLHQEIALLLTKADITEEIDRLSAHCQELKAQLSRNEPIGRRVDFLMQEFNREANTIGSKASHTDISTISVDLKVLIDQVREQIQNVE